MKTITLDYTIHEHKTFTIPQDWQKWFAIWDKDEDERTESEWEYFETHSLFDFLYSMEHVCSDDIEIWDCE